MSKVNHPAHYGGDTVYEVIKVIDAWGLNFACGNAVKYIARAGKKDEENLVTDLEKAIWYLQHEIERLKVQAAKVQAEIQAAKVQAFTMNMDPGGDKSIKEWRQDDPYMKNFGIEIKPQAPPFVNPETGTQAGLPPEIARYDLEHEQKVYDLNKRHQAAHPAPGQMVPPPNKHGYFIGPSGEKLYYH